MAEHLRTDHDRMVGESYKEYAARMRGQALAAVKDRDMLAVELTVAQAAIQRVQARCDAIHSAAREWDVSARGGGYLHCCEIHSLLDLTSRGVDSTR